VKRSGRAAGLAVALLLALSCASDRAEKKAAPVERPKPPESYRVKLETTQGDILIEVKREWAPRGSDHFWDLTRTGFYDNVKFHRVLKQFIAQFGINGDPRTNSLYAQLRIADDPPKLKNTKGTVAFAKIGANSRSTEAFINLKNNPELDSTGFVPFGRVVEGMDTAGKLAFVYGDVMPRGSGVDTKRAALEGNEYLTRHFPRMDSIRKASLVP